MFKTLKKWLRRRIARFGPAYSETLNDEPCVVYVGEVLQTFPPHDGPQGYSETYSEPGVVFEVDCRTGTQHTRTAGN
jgi:hypothetical protein